MDKKLTQAILERIRQYHRIILSRHIRPDGDAVGSTFGLREILRDSYPDKEIFVINEDSSEYLDFLGKEEEQLPDEAYADALLIVLDTATLGRISNSKHRFARETIKIDHHIDTEPYGDLSLVEDGRASTCEMVAAFRALYPEELKLSRRAATFLYTGMVTDTGRFRYREVNGDTIRLAAEMLDTGVDHTENITLHYRDGRTACLTSTAMAQTNRQGVICGDKGFVTVDNINNPQVISVYDRTCTGVPVETLHVPQQITGYEYQVEACMRATSSPKAMDAKFSV